MKRGDMPAQPVQLSDNVHDGGMTIRERMAMAAMQGLCADPNMGPLQDTATLAVQAADALLDELERTQ